MLPFEFATPISQLHLAVAQTPHHHLAAGQTQCLMLPVQLIPLAFRRHCPVPLHQVAGLPVWMILLFLIPLVNAVIGIVMWVKICQARGKTGWLVVMLFIPVVNLIFLPYLAFSE